MRAAVASQGGAVGSLDRHAEKPGTDYYLLSDGRAQVLKSPGRKPDRQVRQRQSAISVSGPHSGVLPRHRNDLWSSQ